jgi:flotillin
MQKESDIKRAEADAAYAIQHQAQRKTIEIETENANIAKAAKEAELAEQRIAIKERELDAQIRKQADAMKYKLEREAEADLIRRTKEAEASRIEAEQAAIARKAEAEALKYAMEQEAAGIRAKGLAEAEAIEKKAEAQKKMGEASVLEMYLSALPEIVKNAAEPLAKTDKIVMYGDGNSTKLMKDVMSSTSQIFEGVKEATGLDMQSMISGFVGGKAAQDTNETKR